MIQMLRGFFAGTQERRDPLRGNPDALSNALINKIGEDYLNHYPEKSFKHDNQERARELKQCRVVNPQDRWILLADVYSKLPNCNGTIASQIEELFYRAFNTGSHQLLNIGDPALCFEPMREIKNIMMRFINQHTFTELELQERGPEVNNQFVNTAAA